MMSLERDKLAARVSGSVWARGVGKSVWVWVWGIGGLVVRSRRSWRHGGVSVCVCGVGVDFGDGDWRLGCQH